MKTSTLENKPGCIAAAALILGDKWTPLLIRALAGGTLRFCELQDEAGGINPRTLSSRLHSLESAGIVSKKAYAEVPPRVEYALTDKGIDLIPILRQMAEWGERYGQPVHVHR